MKEPITDALATIIIMLALIAGGYWYLQHETDPSKETSVLKDLAPKTFERIVKTTE